MLVDIIVQDGPLSVACIILDILIIVCVAVWFLSVRSGKIPAAIRLLLTGVVLFSLTDLVYYYIAFNNIYVPNSLIDVVYIGTLLLVGLGGLVNLYDRQESMAETGNLAGSRLNRMFKEAAVLLAPGITMAVNGFVLFEAMAYLAVVVIYKGLSLYFEAAIKKEALLREEKRINSELEQIIAQHTQNLREMNDQLCRKNETLSYLSNMDTLTNLHNRRYFLERLSRSIKTAEPQKSIALMYIDLDRFKVINDTYGHDMGDRVLVEISKRLTEFGEPEALVARMGGDEFIYVCEGCGSSKKAEELAKGIIAHCSQNIYIDDYVFCPAMCIGISIYPADAADVGTLLKNADIALYQAKDQGMNRCAVFSQLVKEKTQRRNEIEIMLRQADVNREFSLYYQPQFSLPDQKLIGAEALIRWHSSQHGLIMPDEFIRIAEETDHINRIGLWVLKEAVGQAVRWNQTYQCGLKVGINISPKQLNSTDLLGELRKLIEKKAFDPALLDIEITENVAMEGEYRLSQIFTLFKSIGMSVSIDDFGTGYSSVAYLKRLTFDRVKIARPLIDAVAADQRSEQIVRAIVLLAKTIGIKTIAEGVETKAQLETLNSLGCEQAQGFLLGHPMPADAFEETFLKQPRTRPQKAVQKGRLIVTQEA
jgi:diguanylate cyclase (GGDEF)-like protein